MFHKNFKRELSTLSLPIVTRFAPSPTGHLHMGHCLSAIFVWGIGRAINAKTILRIEDHDTQRARKVFEQAIINDLHWLGFIADEGVTDAAMPSAFRQTDCVERYERGLVTLNEKHLTYICSCSRKQIQGTSDANQDELHYAGTCRDKSLSDANHCSIRIKAPTTDLMFVDGWLGVQKQNVAQQCGDFALRDRHGCFTYQYCVASDDQEQGVNLIIRGQDLTASTARQIYLKSMLDPAKAAPCVYLHHPLITDDAGKKLSKRLFSEAIGSLRAQGVSREKVIADACHLSGIPLLQGASSLDEVSAAFAKALTVP